MLLGNYKTSTDTSMTFRLSNEEQDGKMYSGVFEVFLVICQKSVLTSTGVKWLYTKEVDNITFRGRFSRELQLGHGIRSDRSRIRRSNV